MSLDGALEDFNLADVLQIISMGTRTGVLTLTRDKEVAKVFFDSGEPIHAESGNVVGENVVFDVFNWEKGHFRFETSATTDESTITISCQSIIMEATRRIDEWQKIREVITSSKAIIGFESDPGERSSQITLKPNEWRILSLVDGQRCVEDIIEESGFSEFETTHILTDLIRNSLLKITGEKGAEDADKDKPPTASSTSGIRDILSRISGGVGIGEGGIPAAEQLDVENVLMGKNRPQIMQILINAMMEEWNKADGLYNPVELTRSMEALVKDRSSRFPGMEHIKVIDDVLHIPHSDLNDREKEDVAIGLADLSEDLFLMVVKQSNLSAASRRFNRILAKIFGNPAAVEKSLISDLITVKGKK